MSDWTKEQAILNGGSRAEQLIDLLLGKEICVTKQMIRDGEERNCQECPVALAIRAIVPDADIDADLDGVTIDHCVMFATPENAVGFMNRFDFTKNRESMSGFRFTFTEFRRFYCEPVNF